MRTNIVLDDALVEAAMAASGAHSKREVVDLALREMVARRRQRALSDLIGRDLIDPAYDVRARGARRAVVLVDTTVWIDWLRGDDSAAAARLAALLDEGLAALAPVVLQELLQGAANPAALRTLQRRFSALPMLTPVDTLALHAQAGGLYARCRWAGITPRSGHDCLIAALAIERQAPLLHDDRDFAAIAEVDPRLQLVAV